MSNDKLITMDITKKDYDMLDHGLSLLADHYSHVSLEDAEAVDVLREWLEYNVYESTVAAGEEDDV